MKQVVMPFDGKVIETVTGEDGKPWISVRSVCQAIGVAYNSQWARIRGDERFMCYDIITHDTIGRSQEMFCIPLEQLNGWLFSIQPNRVREDIRPNLIRYQQECFQVLYNHFMPNGVQDLQPFMDKLNTLHDDVKFIRGTTETIWGDDREEITTLLRQVAELYQVDGRTVWGWVQTDCDIGSYKRQNRKIINYLKNKLGKGLTLLKGELNEPSAT